MISSQPTYSLFPVFHVSGKNPIARVKVGRIVFFLVMLLFSQSGWAEVPTLGNYSDPSIATAGGNATVSPDVAPTGGASVTAYTTTDFKGLLAVDQNTGAVTITNAHPAGAYVVIVDAGFGITKTFTLTVGNTLCSQGQFYAPATPEVAVGTNPYSVAVGDFNGDGNQDIAAANGSSGSVSIRLGDGQGGYSGTNEIVVGSGPESVAVGDFNGDGKQDIATANRFSNSVSIRLGDGLGDFSGTTNITVGSSPRSVAVGDFNGDGKQDIATANRTSNSVSIRLGDGQGGFSGTSEIVVGLFPYSVAVGDFNGDGNQDIATANSGSNFVSIRLGDGQGGFSGTAEVGVGSQPYSVAVGDFNGDGNQDIATANNNTLGSVSIRLGDGQGGFSGTTEVAFGLNPISVVVGDFNGDGAPDIAAANNSFNSNSVSIRLGDGQGGFSGTTNVAVGSTPRSIAVGDFNGDGKQDIAAANFSSSSVSILLGGFGEINLQGNGIAITSGDNTPDAADATDFGTVGLNTPSTKTYTIQNTGTSNLSVASIALSGADMALFTLSGISLPTTIAAGSEVNFSLNFSSTSLGTKTATVTINSDACDKGAYAFNVEATNLLPTLGNYSDPSIATAGGNATVSPDVAPTGGASVTAYTTTDFKGLLAVDQNTGAVTITNAHPAGAYVVIVDAGFGITKTFTLTVGNTLCSQGQFYAPATPEVAVGTNPYSVAVGDFNGDGNQDIAAANGSSGSVSIRLGDGQGGYSGTNEIVVGSGPESVAVGDFNGDGKQDIATANRFSNSVSIRLGDGLGDFSGTTNITVGSSPRSVAVGDFNGDGKQDIATANRTSNSVSIRLGDGQGGFSGTSEIVVGLFPYSVAVGDFNGDGNQDIATANSGSNFVSIRLGDGQGGFSGTAEVGVGSQPYSVAVGDFNGDGNQDIATANNNTLGSVSIRLGDGQGGFSGTTEVAFGLNPISVVVGDFNGDGAPDIAAANNSFNSNSVSIRLGDGQGGFSGTTNVAVGSTPRSIAVGDFNGDGKQDIAAANFSSSSVSILLGGFGEINLQGNGIAITSGDNTPDAADATDFGTVGLNTPIIKTYTIQNTGTNDLIVSAIAISGTDAASFAIGDIILPATITAGDVATFTVTFTAGTSDVKSATVTITSDDCDESSYTFSVLGIVQNIPTISAGGSLTFCEGENVVLTSSSATGNQWYKGGVLIVDAVNETYTATETGGYTVKVIENSIESEASAGISVTVNALPMAGINNNTATTILTASTTAISVTATGGENYSWTGGTSPNTATNSFTAAGTYTVTVTNTNGCVDTQSITILFATVPDAPTNLVATGINTGGMIQFTVPISNGGADITNYEYSLDGGATWVTPTPAITESPLTIPSGLTNCTEYQVQLRAVNAAGPSAASVAVTLTPAPSTNPGEFWTAQTSAADNNWTSVTYGNGLFVAVARNSVMTSPDGMTWTAQTSAADNYWGSITYGNGLFVAVSYTGNGNRVMTSPDGITWTSRSSAADNSWQSVTYGNGKFVAVASTGTANRVMTSPDGIIWTSRSSAADSYWNSVTYGNGLFVAVASSGTANRMTSPDGVTWTSRVSTTGYGGDVTYGNGLFVAVAYNSVMTSTNGIYWESQTVVDNYNNAWTSVTYGNGYFVAVSFTGTGNRVMTSTDGINWVLRASAVDNQWNSITYGNGKFVAMSSTGTGNRVMTSSFSTVTDAVVISTIEPRNASAVVNFSNTLSANATPITNYEYSTDDGASWTARFPASAASHLTITGLVNTTTYAIKIRAVSGQGTFCASSAVSVTPTLGTVPDAPTNLVTTPINTGGIIAFEAPVTDGGSDITNYEYSIDGGVTWLTPAPAITESPLTIPSGLTNCTDYQVQLRAVNAAGPSAASVAVALTPTLSNNPGADWTAQTSAADNNWTSVTYGNGLFVAVASINILIDNAVMTSPDGITWTPQISSGYNLFTSVTYGNGLFVAVGNLSLMTSPDGITWTSRTAPTLSDWRSVTHGNGLFVAVAHNGGVMTSPDGVTWTSRTSPYSINWKSVTYGNGLFVAVSSSPGFVNSVMTSPDGITWASQTAVANNWTSVTYGNSLFVAVAYNNVMTSPDGITWTAQTSATNNYWNDVTYGNGMFVAVSSTGTGNRAMTSPDGMTWISRASAVDNYWNSVTYGNGQFVAVSSTGTGNRVMSSGINDAPLTDAVVISTIEPRNSAAVVNFSNTLSANATPITNYEYSTDNGVSWTARNPATAVSPLTIIGLTNNTTYTIKIRAVNGQGTFCPSSAVSVTPTLGTVPDAPTNLVATGINTGGIIAFEAPVTDGGSDITNYEYSIDGGVTWLTPAPAITESPLTIPSGLTNCTDYQVQLRAVNAAGPSAASVAVTLTPTLSNNPGADWTSQTSAADNIWNSVTYGNSLFVAIGNNSVMTSPDGITWASQTAVANNWTSVTYGNGLFVAVSKKMSGNLVMTSPDGITWTSRTPVSSGMRWLSVTYGNGLFVAVAITGNGNRVMTSPDGITWTAQTSAVDNYWSSITYGNGQFVAVSITGTSDRVMTSPDGITWTAQTSAVDNYWSSITYGNGQFVAVSSTGTSDRVMTSPDGITWTAQASAADNNWTSVTYGNGQFVAVSSTGASNRVMTSPDGITWTSETSAVDNNWTSVTFGNGKFVAVSSDGTDNRVMTSSFSVAADAPVITSASINGTSATVNFTQTVSELAPTISNYEYSTDSGSTWTSMSPATTTSPLTINGLPSVISSLYIRAVNSVGASCASNDVYYDISFHANGGTGTMSGQSIAFNASENLTSNTFTRTGYTFAGWATTPVGAVGYADAASYTMTDAANVTLYAQWTAINYTVIFDANGGTGTMSGQSIAYEASANLTANSFTRAGYSFTGWNTAADGSVSAYADGANYTMTAAADVTLYAQWVLVPTISAGGSLTFCEGENVVLKSSSATGYQWYKGGALIANAIYETYTATETGVYTVKVTTAGVESAASAGTSVTVNSLPTAGITNNTATTVLTCTTTAISVTATGGDTYSWSDGLSEVTTTATLSITEAGTYTVTVTNANGCSDTESITITADVTAPTAGITNDTGTTELTCTIQAISVRATGGTSYSWSGGTTPTTAENSFTAPGTYTVTVTNANGCSDTESITITADVTAPTTGITNDTGTTELTCTIQAISVRATGGDTYSWSDGSSEVATTATLSITAPGIYTVTVTNANGCSDTESITVTADVTAPTAGITNDTNATVLTCTTTAISVTATGGTSYSWDNGLGNAATASITAPGTYTVTVTNANGCTDTESITITEDVTAPTAGITNDTNETVLTCTTTAISVTATGGTSYAWDNGLGNAATASITTPGTYTVTVTNANGCAATKSITITEDVTAPTAGITNDTNATVLTCTTTAISVTATGGTSYSWDNGLGNAATASITAPGTYTVTVTSANGCSDTESITITADVTAPTAGITNNTATTVLTCTTTAISVTATGGDTYSWSDGLSEVTTTATLSIIEAGTYTVTVTNANGCTDTASITVTADVTAPTAGITNDTNATVLTCTTTAISVTATGGDTYSWSDGLSEVTTTATLSIIEAGTYTVTVTNANGCTDTASITVTADVTAPTAGITNNTATTVLTCTTTAISVTATGGDTYSWSDGLSEVTTTATLSVTEAGTYTVTVTNANGCTDTESITITEDVTAPTAGITNDTNATVLTCTTTAISVTATGGTSYSWDNGLGNAATASITAPGTYTVTVTNANGCTDTESITITADLTAPTAGITNNTATTELTCTTTAISVTATGEGTYSWSDGLSEVTTTATLSIIEAGTYTVTVTNANGCTDTASITVTADVTAPTAGITNDTNATVLTCTTTAISVTATGGDTYSWSDGLSEVTTTATLSIIEAGTYTVTVTNANGCTDTASITVTADVTAPTAGITNDTNATVLTCTTTAISVTATGGDTYSWSDGLSEVTTTATLSITEAGTYTVTVTNANGCTDTESITITEDVTAPTAGITNDTNATVLTCTTTAISVTATGGTSYSWSGGTTPTTAENSFTTPGTYTVTVTNANGCTDTESITVTENKTVPTAGITNNTGVTELSSAVTSISVTATGGVSYEWSTGATSAAISISTPGTYSVTVTAASGCTSSASITISQKIITELTVTGVVTDISCFGLKDGAIDLTVEGGKPPYTFSWSNKRRTADISLLAAGNYTVKVRDASGAIISKQFTVVSPSLLVISLSQTDVSSCGSIELGSITPSATGGKEPYLFSLNTGQDLVDGKFTGLAAGTYTLTVQDANNCTKIKSVTIRQASAVAFTSTKADITSCASNGVITVNATGGQSPYQYSKDGGATWQSANSFSNLSQGTYSLQVKDANECVSSSSAVQITDNGSDLYEDNNILGTAKAISLELTYQARLGSQEDIDWFRYVNPKGRKNARTHYLNFAKQDGQIAELYDQAGSLVLPNAGSIPGSPAAYNLLSGRSYYVKVSGASSLSCYTISLSTVLTAFRIIENQSEEAQTSEVQTSENQDIPGKISGEDVYDVIAYPNPSDGLFRLALPGFADGEARMRIMDGMGRMIQDELGQVENGKMLGEVDLSYVAKGVYYVQVMQEGRAKTIRVILK